MLFNVEITDKFVLHRIKIWLPKTTPQCLKFE
jgi:hypothetical protein